MGFTGEKDVQSAAQKLYHAYHPEMIVITQGSHGGILYDGTQWKTYPAFAVDAVDSNGAGDVFHGAFAFAQVQGLDSAERCIFASAASALKCTKLGARTAAPTYDEVINFLRRNGYGSIEENMEHARRHR